MKVKKTIALDSEVLRKIEDYAEKMGITLTGAISVLCMQTLQTNEAMETMGKIDIIMSQLEELKAKK